MIKTFLAVCGITGALCNAVWADEEGPVQTGRSVAISECDRVAPVCGVMSSERMVSYPNECDARADGASHVVFGGCFDQN